MIFQVIRKAKASQIQICCIYGVGIYCIVLTQRFGLEFSLECERYHQLAD